MKFREYVSAKAITLSFLGFGALLLFILAAFSGVSIQLLSCFSILYLLIISAWLSVSFLAEQRKLKKLENLIQNLPEKHLLGETLPIPSSPVEQRYYRIMKEVSRSAIGAAEQSMHETESYCSYVESWIHEMKTPLTACSLILANDGNPGKLKAELKRADNLTETILYYARLRTLEKDTKMKTFSAAQVIDEAIKSEMELLIAAKIRVETNGDFTITSDSKSLCFILKQLFINCAKYCPGCTIQITAQEGTISVRDNGPGIPSYELGRVFERGFTGSNGKKLGGSTGMGLYIVRELCRHLDIALKMESVQGEGTEVMLTFPSLTKM